MAVLTLLVACSSPEVPVTTASTSAGSTNDVSPASGQPDADGGSADFSEVDDPMDRAFLTELDEKGVLPSNSGSAVPEAILIKDARELCRLATTSQSMGESEQYVRFGFTSARVGHAKTYGLTEAQTTDVMIISAQIYCPESVELVQRALR